MNAAVIVERMEAQDAQILAEWADARNTQRGISKKLGIDLSEVATTITDLCRANRDTARELALAWQQSPKGKRWKAAQAKAAQVKEAEPAPGYVVTGEPTKTLNSTTATVVDPKPEITVDLTPPAPKPTGRPAPHLEAVKAERDAAVAESERREETIARAVKEREHWHGVADQLREQRDGLHEALRRLDEAAGRDIGKPDEPLLDRIADLKRGREEATERALELAKRVAKLEAEAESLKGDLSLAGDEHHEFVEQLCRFIPQEWEARDGAPEPIVVDFVKTVTERLVALGGSLDEYPEDDAQPVNALLAAEASGDATLKAAAFNVRTELRQLGDRVAEWRRDAPLREELARIETRAAEIRAQLGATS
jgi:hypothetical protein